MTYDIVPPHPCCCVVVGLFSPRQPWTALRRSQQHPTESVPVRRREGIGRIRDCGTYFSGFLEEGMRSHLPRRNYRDERRWRGASVRSDQLVFESRTSRSSARGNLEL